MSFSRVLSAPSRRQFPDAPLPPVAPRSHCLAMAENRFSGRRPAADRDIAGHDHGSGSCAGTGGFRSGGLPPDHARCVPSVTIRVPRQRQERPLLWPGVSRGGAKDSCPPSQRQSPCRGAGRRVSWSASSLRIWSRGRLSPTAARHMPMTYCGLRHTRGISHVGWMNQPVLRPPS